LNPARAGIQTAASHRGDAVTEAEEIRQPPESPTVPPTPAPENDPPPDPVEEPIPPADPVEEPIQAPVETPDPVPPPEQDNPAEG
jgi:hypothetical protein